MMGRKWLFLAPLAILGFLFFIAIGGLVVQLLWNWILPPLFGWPSVTYWQALGLLALCRILFGGFSRHSIYGRHRGSRFRRKFRHRMSERWAGMTPEEREAFREAMRRRWSFDVTIGERKE
jgi:hypothetical protein